MRQLQQGSLLQFIDGIPKHVGKFLVDPYESAVQVGDRNTNGSLVENGAEPDVTLGQCLFGLSLSRHIVKDGDYARQPAGEIPNRRSAVFYARTVPSRRTREVFASLTTRPSRSTVLRGAPQARR